MLSRFRPVTKSKGKYPAWVRALDNKSGVYIIRNSVFGSTMYVGESHSGKLYGTLTRHFQEWKGQGSGGTYPLFNSVVAVEVLSPSRALSRQRELIRRLRPLDNERLT